MSAESTASLRYSADHCWARQGSDGAVTIGLTDFAQSALGPVVFAELPAIGTAVEADEAIAEVESTKAVTEIYAPVGGIGHGGERRAHRHTRTDQHRPVRGGMGLRRRAVRPRRVRSTSRRVRVRRTH